MCWQNRWGWHRSLLVCVTSKLHQQNQLLNRALLFVAILYTVSDFVCVCVYFCVSDFVCVCVPFIERCNLEYLTWNTSMIIHRLCVIPTDTNQGYTNYGMCTRKKFFKNKILIGSLLTLIDSQVPLLSIMYQAQGREEPVLYSTVLHFMFECNCVICDLQLKTLFMPFFFPPQNRTLHWPLNPP